MFLAPIAGRCEMHVRMFVGQIQVPRKRMKVNAILGNWWRWWWRWGWWSSVVTGRHTDVVGGVTCYLFLLDFDYGWRRTTINNRQRQNAEWIRFQKGLLSPKMHLEVGKDVKDTRSVSSLCRHRIAATAGRSSSDYNIQSNRTSRMDILIVIVPYGSSTYGIPSSTV
jgi:hypothetical protein